MKTLNKWDIKLIKFFKSKSPDTLADLYQIWADRCDLELEYVESNDIYEHLLELMFDLGLINSTAMIKLIEDAKPKNQWKIGILPYAGQRDIDINWIRALGSKLRNTEVKFLPGYK